MKHPARVVFLAALVEDAELVRLVSLGVAGIILKHSFKAAESRAASNTAP